jgi:flagellar protein FlaI
MDEDDELIMPDIQSKSLTNRARNFVDKFKTKRSKLKFPGEVSRPVQTPIQTIQKPVQKSSESNNIIIEEAEEDKKIVCGLKLPETKSEEKAEASGKLIPKETDDFEPKKDFELNESELKTKFKQKTEQPKRQLIEPIKKQQQTGFANKLKGFVQNITNIDDRPEPETDRGNELEPETNKGNEPEPEIDRVNKPEPETNRKDEPELSTKLHQKMAQTAANNRFSENFANELKKVEEKKAEQKPQDIKYPRLEPEPGTETTGLRFEIDLRPKLIVLPDIKDKTKFNIRYPLMPPYAYAHIFWDNKRNELVYYVQEPLLSDREKELLDFIKAGLEEMVSVPFSKSPKPQAMIRYLEKNVQALLAELAVSVSKDSYLKIMYYVYRNFIGLNEIEPLLRDYYIEDIECNGVNYPIYIVHRKYENLRTNIIYKDVEALADFVEKLAQKTGRYVSYANPLLDGALPDGSRVNATYTKDITTRGPTFTIRKFTREPWTAIHLIDFGTAPPDVFAYLWLAIEHKFNVMVIGETASGKTTFLNTIVHFIPPESRICSIEDTRELNLAHDNWLPSVSRAGFGMPTVAGGEKYGEVSLYDLLRETFRQNPDYVIVGEARGAEASVLFQGMASGHPSFSTFHAGSVETFVRRLETPPINLSPSLVEVLDVVCICSHVKTRDMNIRRIRAIEEVEKIDADWSKSVINHKFKWIPASDSFVESKKSIIFDKIIERTGISRAKLEKEFQNRTMLLDAMHKKKIIDFKGVAQILNDYYNDPEKVLKKFGVK